MLFTTKIDFQFMRAYEFEVCEYTILVSIKHSKGSGTGIDSDRVDFYVRFLLNIECTYLTIINMELIDNFIAQSKDSLSYPVAYIFCHFFPVQIYFVHQ